MRVFPTDAPDQFDSLEKETINFAITTLSRLFTDMVLQLD